MGLVSRLKSFFSRLFRKQGEKDKITLESRTLKSVKPEISEVKVEEPPQVEAKLVEEKLPAITPLKIEPEAKTEIQILYEEYERLNKEKETIRREMEELDRRLAVGELKPGERDRMFREKMVKVVGIAQRILEIRARCAELGKPIE